LPAAHVAMGAVMFLRPVLQRIRFRSEPGRCECSCCCEDIRKMGYGIDYLPGVRAEHVRRRWALDPGTELDRQVAKNAGERGVRAESSAEETSLRGAVRRGNRPQR